MAQETTPEQTRPLLERLDYGEHGLTRNDMRARMADLPDVIYLRLPDSKRFYSADEVLHEVRSSPGRAEGEFIAATDDTEDARGDNGPAGYGDSLLIDTGTVGAAGNTPVPGFDGNSIDTENEFPR